MGLLAILLLWSRLLAIAYGFSTKELTFDSFGTSACGNENEQTLIESDELELFPVNHLSTF